MWQAGAWTIAAPQGQDRTASRAGSDVDRVRGDQLSSKSDDVFEKVRRELVQMPGVMECHLVSGHFDHLLKFRLRGMDEYRKLLGDVLKRLPVPAESQSYVVMEEIKEELTLPVDL